MRWTSGNIVTRIAIFRMLYAAIGLGLGVVALATLAFMRRTSTLDHHDHVAPNVLTRINAEYHEHRR